MAVFNTKLFLEGHSVDLTDNLDIASTYSIDDVKDLTSIASDFTKTITLPGTANNSKVFNYLYNIKASNTATRDYTGPNIGYNYSFVKKAKAVVIQDGAIIFDGYAKLVSATVVDELVSYEIQISSELTSFVSVLASYKLEDLYPSGVTSPYDHPLNLSGVTTSWDMSSVNPSTGNPYPFGKGYFYPLSDYGDYETTNATNFYLGNLRACLFAKTYWDEVLDWAGYTYSSNFLNSDYFNRLIIPYKDGEQLTLGTINLSAVGSSGTTSTQDCIIRDYDEDDIYLYNVGSGLYSGGKFTPVVAGIYTFSATVDYSMVLTQTGGGFQDQILNKDMYLYMRVEIRNTSGDGFVTDYHTTQLIPKNLYSFDSTQSPYTTPTFNTSISCSTGLPIEVGQYAKVSFTVTATVDESEYFRNPSDDLIAGTGTMTLHAGPATNLVITSSNSTEGNTIEFSQFVIKDVKMVDYITSILRLFNLYPVQDRDKPKHFNIYTRDEFYSNVIDTPSFTYADKPVLDWTNKLDKSQAVTVTPIPNLSNSQLKYSYQPDEDWYNTLYKSIWGTDYGQLTIDTGYEFSKEELIMLDGIIFSPTVPVMYGNSDSSPQLFGCEATAEVLTASKDVISVSGYLDSTVSGTLGSGQGFTHARKGVTIIYFGQVYTIIDVINTQSFRVDRDVTRSGTYGSPYYGKFDTFNYQAFNDKIIPAIYQTTDQNVTRKPLKVNPRILYYGGLRPCNPYYIQYTPIPGTSGLTATYPAEPYYVSGNTYPFCSHLNDDQNPTNDLLFFIPSKTFFPIVNYPTVNMFNSFFENQVNELTDPDAKMVKANLKLNSIDISNRDLSNSIFIDGTKYRVNEITDYKPDDSITTQVELIRQPFQEYQTASIELINSISGSTSEMKVSIAPNTGTMIAQYPAFLEARNISGVTEDVTGTLRGLPFGMGPTKFTLNITTPANWIIKITNNGVQIGTFTGTGNDVVTIAITDIREGDKIVITGTVAPIVYIEVIMDSIVDGYLSALTANGVAMTYVSGSTLPLTAGQTATFLTNETGFVNVEATYNGLSASGSTITATDTDGSSATQFIPTGTTAVSFPALIMNAGGTASLYFDAPATYFTIGEDVNSKNTTIAGVSCGGDAVIYVSGDTFPLISGQTGVYKSRNTGLQTVSTSLSVTAVGDVWDSYDSISTHRSTVINSTGTPLISTGMQVDPQGESQILIQGIFDGAAAVSNNTLDGTISSVTGITGFTPPDIPPGGIIVGTHTAFTSIIHVVIFEAASYDTTIYLYQNGTLLGNIPVFSGDTGNKSFVVPHSFLSTDYCYINWE